VVIWFSPHDEVRLETPVTNLATYTFKTGRYKHQFRPNCGVGPFVIGDDGVAINVRCLEGMDPSRFKSTRLMAKVSREGGLRPSILSYREGLQPQSLDPTLFAARACPECELVPGSACLLRLPPQTRKYGTGAAGVGR
jgi:hypothetical protein